MNRIRECRQTSIKTAENAAITAHFRRSMHFDDKYTLCFHTVLGVAMRVIGMTIYYIRMHV
jgi:hypothetical protein